MDTRSKEAANVAKRSIWPNPLISATSARYGTSSWAVGQILLQGSSQPYCSRSGLVAG